MTWDNTFEELGLDAETEVRNYCKSYGVQVSPWVWEKPAKDYKTMNEWFTRSYRYDIMTRLGTSEIVTPASAVVTFFKNVREMPKILKNDKFTISESGIPNYQMYENNACTLHYLSPADYHCYHAPVSGKIKFLKFFNLNKWSVTVKPYVFSKINILTRNKRAVVVIETDEGVHVAMIIIGGVTVDSIRLVDGLKEGRRIKRGEKIGAFARGGSSIAMFFTKNFAITDECRDVHEKGMDFKLEVGQSLGNFC